MQSIGLAEAVENYLAGLIIPQGRFAGQPFPVMPWQSRFIQGAFRDDVLDAALSVGTRERENHTYAPGSWRQRSIKDGPLNSPNAESLLVASSFGQATIAFRHVLRLLGTNPREIPEAA